MSDELAATILKELRELRAIVGRAGALPSEMRMLPEHPMSPEEFATVAGKSPKTVRRWITAGRLKARTDCRPWLITPVNARKFLEGGR